MDTGRRVSVAALTVVLTIGGRPVPMEAQQTPAPDTRQTIVLPEKARKTVLGEMRKMLEALHGVVTAAVEMDRQAMAEAARSGGTRIAVDTDPAVAERLPEAFIRLGASTHRDFDALAEAVGAGAGRDTVLNRLGRLTAKCVSCHASYRIGS